MKRFCSAFSGLFVSIVFLAGCGAGGTLSSGTGGGGGSTGTPAVMLSNTSLLFFATATGSTSAAQSVTVTNTGNGALTGIAVSIGGMSPGGYATTNTCGSSLAAGSTCTISVTYTAPDQAVHDATLSLADNATNSPQTVGLVAEATGCSGSVARPAYPAGSPNYAGIAVSGKVLAGSTPQIGATVQLYAAGASGNGSAATALGSPVTTSATGAFSISAAYTCPNSLSLLYLVARGGQTGVAGTANSAAVMMTALGPCNGIALGTTAVINEATTVAAAYAFAPFLATGGNIGASAGNFRGLGLSAATAANLVNTTTGTAPGASFPATAVSSPVNQINALANALNACVSNAAKCSALYTAATPTGATAPSNTLDAARNIARSPGSNVAAIFAASGASTAYSPADSAAPTDWTVFVTYGGAGMSLPTGLAIDSTGNVWVANYNSVASYFTNTGSPVFPAGVTGYNLYASYGASIDATDRVWIPNEQGGAPNYYGTLSILSSNGTGTGVGGGGLNYPIATLSDTSGNVWVVDYGNSHVSIFKNDGTPVSGATGYTTNQFNFPVAVGVDSRCFGFIGNQSANTVTRVAPDGSDFTSFVVGSGPSSVAADASDSIWTANYYGNSVGQVDRYFRVNTYNSAPSVQHPQSVAIDGSGNVWLANYRGPSVSELASSQSATPGASLTPAAGLGGDAQLLEAFAIAIDSSGNVWVTSFGNSTLTEYVGLATPVRTPLIGPVAPTP